jgi:hypothetical protein
MIQNVMKCAVFWLVEHVDMQFGYRHIRETSELYRVEVCGQLQNQPPIDWLKKYKIENKSLLYGTVT